MPCYCKSFPNSWSFMELFICRQIVSQHYVINSVRTEVFFFFFQCCLLFWYRGTVSSMPSTQCCLASATRFSRTSRTCPRMPPSQNPSLRQTLFLSLILRETASQIHPEAAATPPSLTRHPAPIREARSSCLVGAKSLRFLHNVPQFVTFYIILDLFFLM